MTRPILLLAVIAACSGAPPPQPPPPRPADPPPAPPPEPGPQSPAPKPDGAACLAADECASGICEGQGCGDDQPGACMPRARGCTRDLRSYCGCDGQTFQTSGSCPGRRFAARGKCEGS